VKIEFGKDFLRGILRSFSTGNKIGFDVHVEQGKCQRLNTVSLEHFSFPLPLIPLSPFNSDPFDTRIGLRIHRFEQTILSITRQFFLLLPCYLLVKFNLEG
jgi:hypothetical protein